MRVKSKNGALVAAALFFVIVGIAVLSGRISIRVLGLYGVLSLITFLAYQVDKSAAKNGRWRTPEQTLHLLALAGGWPGAWVAQQVFRHKTKKRSFLIIFWLTVALNGGAFTWLVLHGTLSTIP